MTLPPTNKGKRFQPEPLTKAEVNQLVDAANGRSNSGIRMRALVAVLVTTGLRLQEALDLMSKDVDTVAGTLRVLDGKNHSYRLLGLNDFASRHLDRWLVRRTRLGLSGRQRVFCTYQGRPLSQVYVRNALTRLTRRTDIQKRVHPHGLRHTFAFHQAQRGRPMHEIQKALGHSSLAITDRYIRHLNPTDVVRMMQEDVW